MAKKKISLRKRIHEARIHIRSTETRIYDYTDIVLYADRITTRIAPDGTGYIYMPSFDVFEHISPTSQPQGIVFNNNSFLAFKEIFRYDYLSNDAKEPGIVYLEYTYHYQISERHFFFRYDYHPEVGDSLTHPLYHLHAGNWLHETETLLSVPRFPVSEVSLGDVLELIWVNFFLS